MATSSRISTPSPAGAAGLGDAGARPARPRPRTSVADSVVAEIEESIRSDRLPAGYRLGTKHDLAQQYGVAAGTLGEALRVLRTRGVVDMRPGPGGGLFVAEQSPLLRLAADVTELRQRGASMNDVIEVLDSLDGAVVRDAAAHRTRADMDDLDTLFDSLAEHWQDPGQTLHCNWQLHRRIAEVTPNLVLRAFYLNLVDYIQAESPAVDPTLQVSGFRPDTPARLEVHRNLVEAIRRQDLEMAAQAVRQHSTITG